MIYLYRNYHGVGTDSRLFSVEDVHPALCIFIPIALKTPALLL